jgi:cytochrome c biogenesis protein CcmG, thiol:disulfide interchange protein DsbE
VSVAAWSLAATLVAGLLPPTPTPAAGGVQVGKPLPAFSVRGLEGHALGQSVLRGRAAFINVFATWCGPCRQELPVIVASYPRYRATVTFLGIDEQEPAAKVAPFVKEMKIPYAVGIDEGQMAATYGAASIPHSVFVDKNGIVRAVFNGPLTAAALNARMTLIAGK